MTAEETMDTYTQVVNDVSSERGVDFTSKAASTHQDLTNGMNDHDESWKIQVNGDVNDFVFLNRDGEEKSIDVAVDGYHGNGKVEDVDQEVEVECKPDGETIVQNEKVEEKEVECKPVREAIVQNGKVEDVDQKVEVESKPDQEDVVQNGKVDDVEQKIEVECKPDEEDVVHNEKLDDVEQKVEVEFKPEEEVVVQNGKVEFAQPTAQMDVGTDTAELNSVFVAQEEPQTEEIVIGGSVSDENRVGQPLSIDNQAKDDLFDSFVPIEGNKITSEQNGSSKHTLSMSFPTVVCEIGCADESLTTDVSLKNNSSFPNVVESDQSVETASFLAADVQSEKHTSEIHASDESGEGSPTGNTHDEFSGWDLVDANEAEPEQNGHSDITGLAEGVENLRTAPVDAIVETTSAVAVQSKKDTSESHVSDENGEGLPTGNTHDKLPGSDMVDVNKSASEQNGHFDITGEAEGAENLPSAHVDAIVEPAQFLAADVLSEKYASDEYREGMPNGNTRNKLLGRDLVDANEAAPEQNGHYDATRAAESIPTAPVDAMVVAETENGISAIAQEIPVSADDNESGSEVQSGSEVLKSDLKILETTVSHSVDFTNVESGTVESESEVVKSDLESCDTAISQPVDCTIDKSAIVESEVNSGLGDKDATIDGDINPESKVSEAATEGSISQSIPGEESDKFDSVENESRLTGEVKPEPEIDNAPALNLGDMAADETIVSEPHDVNVSDSNNECASNSDQNIVHVENGKALVDSTEALVDSAEAEPEDINVSYIGSKDAPAYVLDVAPATENGGTHSISEDNDDKTDQETETADSSHKEEASTSCPEGSTIDALERQSGAVEVGRRPFNFMIKVPRYDDENLKEQIQRAQFQVEQKTQSRDDVRVEIQKQRDTCMECGDKFDAAIYKERAARDLLKSKRKEMDSVQSVINKVKDAMSIDDIAVRLHNLEHMISHETHDIKKEKQMIREIKQMKQLREQISSNIGKHDDVQQALDQKDEIQERLKVLRKEADSLKANVLKAEAVTQTAKKKYYDECDNLSKLQAQFRTADDIRQEAYVHLQSSRKQLNEKNKYFWQYKDDFKAANDLVLKGDRDAIQRLCVNQVERFMKLWNENDEFRKEYVRCNTRSTLRRLRTLDGRSLGPDETPPFIPNPRFAKDQTVTPISTSGGAKQKQDDKKDTKPADKIGEQKQADKFKTSAKPVSSRKPANGLATIPSQDDVAEAREEELKKTKEEEELKRTKEEEELKRTKNEEEIVRKADEFRKEEEAQKLKEQCRLEEKAKAIEALERKKRQAEKSQARAALRAQKESEQKEREREKRLMKKEKRKAGATIDTNVINEEESAPISESIIGTPNDSETKEKSTVTTTKRPKKPSQFTKQQPKTKSIPPPLRNRGKRRMQMWMWALLAALIIFGLFFLGNSSSSVNFEKLFS